MPILLSSMAACSCLRSSLWRGWPLFYAANAFAEALRLCGDLVAWSSVVSALIFVAEEG